MARMNNSVCCGSYLITLVVDRNELFLKLDLNLIFLWPFPYDLSLMAFLMVFPYGLPLWSYLILDLTCTFYSCEIYPYLFDDTKCRHGANLPLWLATVCAVSTTSKSWPDPRFSSPQRLDPPYGLTFLMFSSFSWDEMPGCKEMTSKPRN